MYIIYDDSPAFSMMNQEVLLGAVLFLYTRLRSRLFSKDTRQTGQCKYADDNTLYRPFSPGVPGCLERLQKQLVECFNEVQSWFVTYRL